MAARSLLRLLLLFAALAALAPPASADSLVRFVRLSFVEGDVQIDRGDGLGFSKAFANMPVSQGVRLLNGSNGRAEVQFEDGSALRLAPESGATFVSLGLFDSGQRYSTVILEQGTAYINFTHDKDDQFALSAAGHEIPLKHSGEFRVDVNGDQVTIAALSGELEIPGTGKVKKGETLTITSDDAARYYLAKNIQSEAYDDWNDERNGYLEQYASAPTSTYAYGASDLSYYGSYMNVAGYGPLWRPYGVGLGWDPFFDGAWAFYPGFGYAWVSAYPWGWLPFHFGSWFYLPVYGWCWQPGFGYGYHGGWGGGPHVVTPPVWFHPPVAPPHAPGGPGFIAVGHGPSPIVPRGVREPGQGFVPVVEPVAGGAVVSKGAAAGGGPGVSRGMPSVDRGTRAAGNTGVPHGSGHASSHNGSPGSPPHSSPAHSSPPASSWVGTGGLSSSHSSSSHSTSSGHANPHR